MQLVAAAKMKKAQDQALAGRDYSQRLNAVLADISKNFSEEATHPLLNAGQGERELILVISTDKGLCGPLNTNLAKKVRPHDRKTSDFVTVGRKHRILLEKLDKEMVADFHVKDPVPFAEARAIAILLTKLFLEGKYSKVSIAYTRFINTLSQEPELVTLLPVQPPTAQQEKLAADADYLFEPNPKEVLASILPLYINYQVYQALLEARATEHSARMVAMKAATDNAKKFIKELTLEYNKVRQAAITSELLEITTAMKAME